MIVPLILFIASLTGIGAALALPELSDAILIAAPAALASLLLLLWEVRGGRTTRHKINLPSRRPRRSVIERERPKHIVVDGSNVMHWKVGTAQIETVRAVVDHLKQRGFTPGVVFDANAGHILTGKYQHHGAMGRLLGLSEEGIMVVDKGTPADPTILAAAKDLKARIVTNDRYRDWVADYPEILVKGQLVRGGYSAGALWLDLEIVAP